MAQDLDVILRKVREGKLVASGPARLATIGSFGIEPEPGEVLAGPFLIVSVERRTDAENVWDAEIVRLVEADPSN